MVYNDIAFEVPPDKKFSDIHYLKSPPIDEILDDDYGEFEEYAPGGDALIIKDCSGTKPQGSDFCYFHNGKLVSFSQNASVNISAINSDAPIKPNSSFLDNFREKEPNVDINPKGPFDKIKNYYDIPQPMDVTQSMIDSLPFDEGFSLVNTKIKNLSAEMQGIALCDEEPSVCIFLGATNSLMLFQNLGIRALSVDPATKLDHKGSVVSKFSCTMVGEIPVTKNKEGLFELDYFNGMDDFLELELRKMEPGSLVYLHSDICTQNEDSCSKEIFMKQRTKDMEISRDFYSYLRVKYPDLKFFGRLKVRMSTDNWVQDEIVVPLGTLTYPCGAKSTCTELSYYYNVSEEKKIVLRSNQVLLACKYYAGIRTHYMVSDLSFSRNSFDDCHFKHIVYALAKRLKQTPRNIFKNMLSHYCIVENDKIHKSFFHAMSYFMGDVKIFENIPCSIDLETIAPNASDGEVLKYARRKVPKDNVVTKIEFHEIKESFGIFGKGKIIVVAGEHPFYLYNGKKRMRVGYNKTCTFMTQEDFCQFHVSFIRNISEGSVYYYQVHYANTQFSVIENPYAGTTATQKRNRRYRNQQKISSKKK